MALQDIATYITMAAGVIAAIYAVVSYHRPKSTPVSSVQKPQRGVKATAQPSVPAKTWGPFWPIALAVIAWSAAGFDYVDRHWFSTLPPTELPLTSNNARLDATKVDPSINDKNVFWLNVNLINNGPVSAIGMRFIGNAILATGVLDSDMLDAMFFLAKKKLERESTPTEELNNEIEPRAELLISMPQPTGLPLNADQLTAVKNGTNIIYIINVVRYRDNTLSPGKHIYGERCVYYISTSALHFCETGHNRNYISD